MLDDTTEIAQDVGEHKIWPSVRDISQLRGKIFLIKI